jgi:hypothetical protein
MGSVLGLLVVVGTIGVLGYGAVLLLEQRAAPPLASTPSPVPVASPTLAVTISPSAVASVPSSSSNPTEAPTATVAPASATPGITSPPAFFVPQVLVGPGHVTFGTDSDAQLNITDARATFGPDERIVWSAQLTELADSTELRIQVLKLDPAAPGGQRLVRDDEVRPLVDAAQTFLRRVRVDAITEGPGLYTVRYVRGETILSEGSFLVAESG